MKKAILTDTAQQSPKPLISRIPPLQHFLRKRRFMHEGHEPMLMPHVQADKEANIGPWRYRLDLRYIAVAVMRGCDGR